MAAVASICISFTVAVAPKAERKAWQSISGWRHQGLFAQRGAPPVSELGGQRSRTRREPAAAEISGQGRAHARGPRGRVRWSF